MDPLTIIGLTMAAASLAGKGINMFRSPYKGVREELNTQYGLADLQGQRDLQGQLSRANRAIGARLASVGALDPMGYAGQAGSESMFRSLADLRAQLGQGKAAALADLAYRQAEFRNQAINEFLNSLSNAGQTALLGGMTGRGGTSPGPVAPPASFSNLRGYGGQIPPYGGISPLRGYGGQIPHEVPSSLLGLIPPSSGFATYAGQFGSPSGFDLMSRSPLPSPPSGDQSTYQWGVDPYGNKYGGNVPSGMTLAQIYRLLHSPEGTTAGYNFGQTGNPYPFGQRGWRWE